MQSSWVDESQLPELCAEIDDDKKESESGAGKEKDD